MLTLEAVTAELDKIVSGYGYNHLYREPGQEEAFCTYAKNGKPDCIIGHLLSRLEPDTFQEVRVMDNSSTIRGVIDQGLVQVEGERVKDFLGTVQGCQDMGNAWGDAVKAGKDALGI